LAVLFNSEVLVLQVWPPIAPLYVLPGVPVFNPDPAAIFLTPEPERDKMTAPAAEQFRGAGLKVTRMSTDGDAAADIIDRSKAEGADLIAMGTHGRSGPSRWVLGSVAERVLRHAEVPLLLVRWKGEPGEMEAKKNGTKSAIPSTT
jgi:nucleotide-binding universal stress UspA family protein